MHPSLPPTHPPPPSLFLPKCLPSHEYVQSVSNSSSLTKFIAKTFVNMHTSRTLLTCLRAEYANHQKFKRQFPLHTFMDWFGVCYGQLSIIHTRVFVALGHLSRNTKCILCVSEENCLHKCSTTSQIRALQLPAILETKTSLIKSSSAKSYSWRATTRDLVKVSIFALIISFKCIFVIDRGGGWRRGAMQQVQELACC